MLALLQERHLAMFPEPTKLTIEDVEDIKAKIKQLRSWTITSDASVSLSPKAQDTINKMAS